MSGVVGSGGPAVRCRTGRARTDRGSMAVEIVLLVPVLVALLLLVVAFGRYVSVEGATEAAAREAVRAASFERDAASAGAAARAAAAASAPANVTCEDAVLTGDFDVTEAERLAGELEIITVDVRCSVSWAGLGFIGLTGEVDVTGTSSAPLDRFRRTGAP